MSKAIDCASKLNVSSVKGLKEEGITHIARYLDNNWKGLTFDEAKAISDAGLEIISVFETNPTKASYFTHRQGKQDAQNASKYAKELGQAKGSAIYFTVDYDAQGKDLGAVLDYFSGVNEGVDPIFKVGAYGSFTVLTYLDQQSNVDYFFQTYAWSHGQVCNFSNLYQHENGIKAAGIQVDLDKVLSDPGSWSLQKPKPVPKPTEEVSSVKQTFKDVPPSRGSFGAIEEAFSLGLIHGYPDGTYKPTGTLTREQAAEIALNIYKATKK